MHAYLELLRKVLDQGVSSDDRTGVGTRALFGERLEIDLSVGFPLLTTKRVHWPSIAHELLWFLRGDTNVRYLNDNGVTIWDEWADDRGDLGPVYGAQWRRWQDAHGCRHDQIARVVEELRTNPESRRHVVSAWNPGDRDRVALPWCHALFQFRLFPDRSGGSLDCQVYQRSADVFLGLPFNIASYALLTCMVARAIEAFPRRLIFCLGDVHLYANHKRQAAVQIVRTPRARPSLRFAENAPRNPWDLEFDHFEIAGYRPASRLSAPVAV